MFLLSFYVIVQTECESLDHEGVLGFADLFTAGYVPVQKFLSRVFVLCAPLEFCANGYVFLSIFHS